MNERDDWPILEGLVTTRDPDGSPHLAPMGPRVSPDWSRLLFRPFPTSHTGRNLIRDRQGVLHVTDDVGLIARAALGEVVEPPGYEPARTVEGFVISDACRAIEFRVREVDDSRERIHLDAEVVLVRPMRDFFGFNRAKHAVLEAAILATRFEFLDSDDVRAEFGRLAVIVSKTAAAAEREAFRFLEAKLSQHLRGKDEHGAS